MSIRLFLIAGAVTALVASAAALKVQSERADRLADQVAGHAACVASVEGAKGARPSDETCAAPIAVADRIADRAMACEGALKVNVNSAEGTAVTASNGVAVMAACLPEVARLFGQSLADASTVLDLRGQLDVAAQDRNRAVARAEARGRALAERDLHAEAVRESAPLDGDGLRAYDAERLRQRFEVKPAY
jgi:hypothetical protein